jgi:hypothetical protein
MFYRNCPSCNNVIEYKSKYTHEKGLKSNTECKKCYLKKIITPERKKKMSENMKGDKNPMFGKTGEKNPFFGKNHTEETKKKMNSNKDYSVYKTDEFRNKISKTTKGNKNPMYGKNFYQVWVENFGEKIADEKLVQFKLKVSTNSSGNRNPMYGKITPQGSGNGWSGWYNGWFFRSIKELTYMIKIIERFNLSWKTAESSEYSIKYMFNNSSRTYHPDFVINNKYLVEIKPKRLWSSFLVNQKKIAAKLFCEKNGLIYKLVDITSIDEKLIIELHNSKKIKFTERYEKKFRERFLAK